MSRSRKVASFSLISLILISCFVFYYSFASYGSGLLKVSFLDIGQGDAIYIEAPDGTQFIVDGALANGRLLPELGAVMPYFDRTIDGIMVTNPDADHYAGFLDVLPRYHIGMVFESGTYSDTAIYASFEKKIKEQNIPKVIAQRGMRIILDKKYGVYLEILFPDRDVGNWNINDGSIVSKLIYGSTSLLLQGDSPQKIEKYLIAIDGLKDRSHLDADILKVGHHGSKTSTAKEYVQAVSPDFAIISDGQNNRYGHPHKETLDTLSKENVEILRTDLEGRITFVSDGKSFVRTE